MDIAAFSMMLHQGQVQQQAGISVMKMAMDVAAEKGTAVAEMASETNKAMELSVQPNVGRNIDVQA